MSYPLVKVPKPKGKRVKRSRTPLRKTRLKKFNKRRGGHAFPKNVDLAYRAWIRSLPCILAGRFRSGVVIASFGSCTERHYCFGRVQGCHVKSRATGGVDVGNMYPGCARAHDEQGQRGIPAFQERWGVNLTNFAAGLGLKYQERGGF